MSDYVVKSLVDFQKVVSLLASADRKMGLTEMSEELGMNKTRLFRILSTCVDLGMVEQLDAEYILGWKLFELGQKVLSARGFKSNIHGILEGLRNVVDETINLGILINSEILFIDVVESNHNLNASFKVGTHLPSHLTSIGKAILSTWENGEIYSLFLNKPFVRHTPNSVSSVQGLIDQMEDFRKKGWALDDEEYAEGIRCVATPVYNHAGKVIAAVSFSGPVARMTMGKISSSAQHLLDSASEISAAIGGSSFFV